MSEVRSIRISHNDEQQSFFYTVQVAWNEKGVGKSGKGVVLQDIYASPAICMSKVPNLSLFFSWFMSITALVRQKYYSYGFSYIFFSCYLISQIRDLPMYPKMVPHCKKVDIYETSKFLNVRISRELWTVCFLPFLSCLLPTFYLNSFTKIHVHRFIILF